MPKGGEFENEIIWCYSQGGKSETHFGRKHDVLLWYTKSSDYYFDGKAVRLPLTPHKQDASGRNYGGRMGVDEEGREYTEKWGTGKKKLYRYYLDEGKIPEDWWVDINSIQADAKERLGYPTQKPEALLRRIIKACTKESDIVLDAYCGCGTTIAVAQQLNRRWIGIDITVQSISLILKRIEDSFGKSALNDIEINGIPRDIKSAVALANKKDDKTRKEFEKWAVLTYSNNRATINEKKGSDFGIDGVAYTQDRNEKGELEFRQVLFSVKSDKTPHSSYIRDFNGTIEREKAAMGYFVTLYPPTKDMVAECNKLDRYHNNLMDNDYPKITIVTVENMLAGERITIPTSHEVAVVKSAQMKAPDQEQLL